MEDAFDIENFALRPVDGVSKMSNVIDVIKEHSLAIDENAIGKAIEEWVKENPLQEWWRNPALPDVLRPKTDPPPNTKLQVIIVRQSEEKVNLLKHYMLDKAVKPAVAKQLCFGEAFSLPYKASSWGLKKGFQALLARVVGYHIVHAEVVEKQAGKKEPKGWYPSQEEIKVGFKYINRNCPPGYEANEILEWIVLGVKDQGGPIANWPMTLVEKACNNLTKKSEGADTEYFFPLVATSRNDFKPFLVDVVLPLIFASCLTTGLLVVGPPGVGKTPWALALSMAFGRFHVRTKGLKRRAGWRRGKMFDVFREKPGEVQEAVNLDDPTLPKIDVEDVKSYGDSGYAGHSDSRYKPPKWAKNQLHNLLTNKWFRHGEPLDNDALKISHDDFMKMVGTTFGHLSDDDKMAIFKRYVTLIVGLHALYVRVPSEETDVPIFRFTEDNVHKDFLNDPGHKEFFGLWKRGQDVEYPGFDEAVREEQAMMDKVMEATRTFKSEKDIVPWYEKEIVQPWYVRKGIHHAQANEIPPTAPSTPGSSQMHVSADRDGKFRFPPPAPYQPMQLSAGVRRFKFKKAAGEQDKPQTTPQSIEIKREPLEDEEFARLLVKTESQAKTMHGEMIDLMSPSPSKKPRTSSDAEGNLDEDGLEKAVEAMLDADSSMKSMDDDEDDISEGTPQDTIGMSASSAHAPSHPSKFWGKGLSANTFPTEATTKKKQAGNTSDTD